MCLEASQIPLKPTRGDILHMFGRDEEAIAAYGKTLELKPDLEDLQDHATGGVQYREAASNMGESTLIWFALCPWRNSV